MLSLRLKFLSAAVLAACSAAQAQSPQIVVAQPADIRSTNPGVNRDNTTYGVLKLTLKPGTYAWEFIPMAGKTFTDTGTGTCSPKK